MIYTSKLAIIAALSLVNYAPALALRTVPEGWIGGFMESNPDYSYGPFAFPDISDLEITGNLVNIDKITRMQKILWPEFSWQSIPGDESSRVYEMFARDISRIGYDDTGRIWSIICPQRKIPVPPFGTVLIEVTVTGVRGWVDELNHSAFANIGIQGNIWIDPSTNNTLVKEFAAILKAVDMKKFPTSKENAIKVKAHAVGKPYEEFWPMSNGTDPTFYHPLFTRHWDESYSVYNLEVEMGKQILTGDNLTDDFNAMVLKLFNQMTGNLVAEGQKVAWNVWVGDPELVDTDEWKGHADKWFRSIDVKHEYSKGDPGIPRYADGTPFVPNFSIVEALKTVKDFAARHSDVLDDDVIEKRQKGYVKGKPSLIGFIKDHLFE